MASRFGRIEAIGYMRTSSATNVGRDKDSEPRPAGRGMRGATYEYEPNDLAELLPRNISVQVLNCCYQVTLWQ
jgi:hypothetical protein